MEALHFTAVERGFRVAEGENCYRLVQEAARKWAAEDERQRMRQISVTEAYLPRELWRGVKRSCEGW